jgi:hypothetical protein
MSRATQTGIAINRVLADMGSADQLAHADPALRVACPSCEALSHQRCLERNPKQYVTPHAARAALATRAAA